MGPGYNRTEGSATALNTSTFVSVGSVPRGAVQAIVTIDDGTAGWVKVGGGAQAALPANGAFVVWDGPALHTALAVTVKASAGTPNGVLTYIAPAVLP